MQRVNDRETMAKMVNECQKVAEVYDQHLTWVMRQLVMVAHLSCMATVDAK